MYEYQNFKLFLQMPIFQIGLKKFLWLKNLKKTFSRGHMLLVILMKKKCLERFTKKSCKKQIKMSLDLRKRKDINYKRDNLYVKYKEYDNSFNSWIDKKYIV